MKFNRFNVELNKIYSCKSESEVQRNLNFMKGFTNVQYAHRLRHGTREVGTSALPEHAAASLG